MSARTCLTLAAIFGFFAVLTGAFGAHGLSGSDSRPGFLERKYANTPAKKVAGMEQPASFKYLQDFRTGVRYHMWHALALFGVGLLMQNRTSKLLAAAASGFVGGVLLFSGGLYVLVICGPTWCGVKWGLVVPVGGTLFLLGWLLLAVFCFKSKPAVV